ncbi:hypothetical protein HED60_19630 [Planctomycetales bacterium ZRK34]|nr:hypothetical protein HED60_19630 [Planctomycetales bacterium ZRK34]
MDKTELKVKTTAMIGAPDREVPDALRTALTSAVDSITQIIEAHLAEVHIPGMIDPAALTLVVIIDADADEGEVLRSIDQALQSAATNPDDLGVWPLLPDDEALPAIRSLGCRINSTG